MPLIETIGDTIDREGWIKKLEARIDELENTIKPALKTWNTKINVEIKQMFGNATPEELLEARDRFTQAMTELSETVK